MPTETARNSVPYEIHYCRGWMKDAGFKETRVEHLVGPDSMVVGIK